MKEQGKDIKKVSENIRDNCNLNFYIKEFKPFSEEVTGDENKIALIIRGQLRTFNLEIVQKSLTDFLHKLMNDGFYVVCFFYVNVNKQDAENMMKLRYKSLCNSGKFRNEKECNDFTKKILKGNSERIFKKFIVELKTDYVVDYYNDYVVKKILSKPTETEIPNTHRVQRQLDRHSFENIKKFEKQNNLEFGRFITTRPDLLYTQIDNFDITENICYWRSDLFRVYPRNIFSFICSTNVVEIFVKEVRSMKNKIFSMQSIYHCGVIHIMNLLGVSNRRIWAVKLTSGKTEKVIYKQIIEDKL